MPSTTIQNKKKKNCYETIMYNWINVGKVLSDIKIEGRFVIVDVHVLVDHRWGVT
jgi:hypothetical protein